MRTKEITVELKLVAQPKQYQSLTVGVSATMEMEEGEGHNGINLQDQIGALRIELSEQLTKGIYEEIKKLYGEPAARAALVAYFGQGQGGNL